MSASFLRLESNRKTDTAVIAKMAMGAVAVFVVGMLAAYVWVQAGYLRVSEGDFVRHSKYPGQVESVAGGEATVTTFDGMSVKVPVAELVEQ